MNIENELTNIKNELTTLKNIVRVGMVSSADAGSGTARVAFADKPDTDGKPLISAPLQVVARETPWLPYVGQFVLCVYLPNGEGDGFVIGGI